MMVPVLFWQSGFFRAFRFFRGSNSCFLPFAGTLKGPLRSALMNEKENSNYQPRKIRKYIKQPTRRLVCKSGNPRKRSSLAFQLGP
jgi:hypothetical protein